MSFDIFSLSIVLEAPREREREKPNYRGCSHPRKSNCTEMERKAVE